MEFGQVLTKKCKDTTTP